MTSLGETVAALTKQARGSWPAASTLSGRLREVDTFGTNPGALRMLLHVPERLAPKAAMVVVLHGCTQTAEAYAEGAGWLALADLCGFVVLCPEQTRGNNPNLCFNWFHPSDTSRDAGEAASIRQMIERAHTDLDLDPRRVFVTGLSAGGAMTAAMLASYPEVFVGGAIMAGLPYGSAGSMQEAFSAMNQGRTRTPDAWGGLVRAASSHTGPWPRVSIWHGQNDATVRPGAADDLVDQWTNVHGLGEGPVAATSVDGRSYLVWRQGGVDVIELHRIPHMAHGTALKTGGTDGVGTAGPYLLEVGTSSTLEVARSWGLATAAARAPAETRMPVETRERAAKPVLKIPMPPGLKSLPGKVDVNDVISKALRSAGLMK